MRRSCFVFVGLLALAGPGRANDYFWSNAAGGAYATAANWNGGVVPTGADDATVNLGGTYTVTLTAAAAVNDLTLDAAGLSLNHTAGTYTVNGTVTLSAGTYNLNGGTVSGGTLTQGGGTGHVKFGASATNTLNNVQVGAGALDFSTTSGRVTFTGGTNFTAASSYSLAGSFLFSVNQVQSIDNLTLVLGNSSQFRAVGTSGLTIGATSTVTFSGTTATVGTSAAGFPLVNNGLIQNTGTGTLNLSVLSTMSNAGTVRQTTAGTLTVGAATGAVTNEAAGLVDVQAGTANFLGTFLNHGTVRVAAGAAVNLGGSYTSSLLGRFDRGGALPVAGSNGTVSLTGGPTVGLTLTGPLDLHTSTGPLRMNHGSISGDGNTLTTSGGSRLTPVNPGLSLFNYLDNVVVGPGVLDLSTAGGRLLLTGGTTFAPGVAVTTGPSFDLRADQTAPVDNLALVLGNGATLRANGTDGLTLGPNTVVTYGGTTAATVGAVAAANPVTNQGVIENTGTGALNVSPVSPLTNAGTIRNTSTGTLNVGSGTVAFANLSGGTIHAQAGTTTLEGTLANAGVLRISDGATLNLAGSYSSDTLGAISRGGFLVPGNDGTLQLTGGTATGLTLAGNVDLFSATGPLSLNNGTVFGAGFALTTSNAAAKLVATPAPGAGTFNYVHNVALGAGVLDLSATGGRLHVHGGTTFAAGSAYTTGSSFDLRVDQTQSVDNLALTLGNSAALRAGGANGMTLGPNAVVTYGGTTVATVGTLAAAWAVANQGLVQNVGTGTLNVNPISPLTNAGAIRNTSTGVLNVGSGTVALVNQSGGLIDAQAGTVNLDGTLTNTGTIRVAPGAALNLGGAYSSATLGRLDRGGTAPVAGSDGTVRLTGGAAVGLTLAGNLDLHTSTGPLLLNNGTVFGNGHTLTTSGGSRLVATNAAGTGTFNYLNGGVVGPGVLDLSAASGKLLLTGGTTFQPGPAVVTGPNFDLRVDQPQVVGNLNLTLGNGAALRAGGANGMHIHGVVRYSGATLASIGSLSAAWPVTNQGVFKNESTGTFAVSPPSTLTNNSLVWNAGSGLTVLNPATLTVGSSGVLEATSGTLRVPDSTTFTNFASGILSGGTYRASNGGVIDFGSRQITTLELSTNILFGPGGSIPALGTLNEIKAGAVLDLQTNFNFAGNVTNNGLLIVEGGLVTVPGTVANTGILTVKSGGTLQGSQNVTVSAGGRLDVLDSGRVSVPANRSLIVEGGLGNPGVLTGTGTIGGGLVRVLQNAQIKPGQSPGVITIENGLELGGTYEWDLTGNTNSGGGVNFDVLKVTGGSLTILPAAAVVLNLTGVDFADPFWAASRTWPIAELTDAQLDGAFAGPPTIGAGPDPTAYGTFGFEYLNTGNTAEVDLTWTPVPEPGRVLGLASAFLAALVSPLAFRSRPRTPSKSPCLNPEPTR